jgi:Lysozyme like domain
MVPLIALGVIGIAVFLIYINGASMDASQIAPYAIQAGFSGNDLAVAIAVALAESGGNPRAYNPETAAGAPDGKGSYGLWQIYLNAHPEFTGDDLYDPQTNANDAYEVYVKAGNSFGPWSTFNPRDGSTPKYLSHLAVAQSAISA